MARQRRGGGFRPPELRGTLGTLLRTTLAQAGTLRDAIERGAREGRHRLDDALAGRRRTDALAELGEIVLDLIRRGEIDTAELPEVADVVAHLDELDAGEAHEEPPVASHRQRFDARARDDEDGTVSSSRTWSPPTPKKPAARVWRPPVDEPPARHGRPADEIPSRERPAPVRSAVPIPGRKDSTRKGGISFEEEDEDLADYMHPDDIPPKGSDGDS